MIRDSFSGLLVLCAGWPTQPSGEAVCGQSVRANTHPGAHTSREPQTAVRRAPIPCLCMCFQVYSSAGVVLEGKVLTV